MLELKKNVGMVKFSIFTVIITVFIALMVLWNNNPRLTKFRFEFKVHNMTINTEAEYDGDNIHTKEKVIEENPNDPSR